MKNVWNSSENKNTNPLKFDEKVKKGELVRFTHFPSFSSFVGIYLGIDEMNGRVRWKFATDKGLELVEPRRLSYFRLDVLQ